MFDIILAGGKVVDGTGAPWFRADVGIRGERIAAVGNLARAEAPRRLDVSDLVVAPGFIDAHVHGDLAVLADPRQPAAIHQGVTTYIIAQDGCGFAPASPATIQYMRDYTAGFSGWFPDLTCDWRNLEEYFERFHQRASVNIAYLVPNGTLRMEAMGLATRAPTQFELDVMARLCRDALEQGAVGLSTGLDYIPSKYADAGEIAHLCKVIAEYDGVYVSHVRAQGGPKYHEALDELAAIGRASGAAVHVSHFSVRADVHLPRIDAFRNEGLDVTFDTYPYLAGMTILAMIVLPDALQEGGVARTLERLSDRKVEGAIEQFLSERAFKPDNIRLAWLGSGRFRSLEGSTLAQAKEESGLAYGSLVRQLLSESNLAASAVVFDRGRTEADLEACMIHPAQMASSDGIFTPGVPHPRGYGAFARFLGRYAREKRTWRLEDAVRHLSYHAARRFRLPQRGLIAAGMIADLVVFDPDEIGDRSNYLSPVELAVGVRHVLVGGTVTLEDGRHTGATAGQVVRAAR